MFGDRLRLLRKSRGLTIEELAHKLDVAYSTIGMYEGHKRSPKITMLCKIADFFNVSIDYLVGRTDIPDPPVASIESPK